MGRVSRVRANAPKDLIKRNNSKQFDTKNTANVTEIRNESQKAQENKTSDNSPCPSSLTSLKLLFSATLCSVVWTGISDCDETYNYWEPTHLLIYGTGFQTWEYSPIYALRSYLYLWPQALIGKLCLHVFNLNKISTFYTIRLFLGFISALCQLYFYQGICKKFGAHVGRLTLVFLIFSTGMFISSTAYLPSSFAMYTTMIAFGSWFKDKMQFAILSVALGAILGWPFAALIGVPLAFNMIFIQKRIRYFIIWSIISLLLFLIPTILVDSFHYGRLVIAPLNIITYNVFSKHGPDIYGVEPWSFYFLNAFLNFNFAFICALISAPILLIYFWGAKSTLYVQNGVLTLTSMYLWIAVFFTRPHKEERFLFPIYPLICLASAITIDCVKKLIMQRSKRKITINLVDYLTVTLIIVTSLLSLSRSVILYKGYCAPIEVFLETNSQLQQFRDKNPSTQIVERNLCVGKEWHRFPSSFFLPDGWKLQFLKSEFKGQLPQPFANNAKHPTSFIPENMNDMNLEEISRYIDLKQCHYLIDADFPYETKLEPRFSQDQENWRKIASVPFLNNQNSSKWFRSFYVPYFTETKCSFIDYNVLKHFLVRKENL